MKTLLVAAKINGWATMVASRLRAEYHPLRIVTDIRCAKHALEQGEFGLVLLDTFRRYGIITHKTLVGDIQVLDSATEGKLVVLCDDEADSGRLAVECLRCGADGIVSDKPTPTLAARIQEALHPLRLKRPWKERPRSRKVFVAMPFSRRLRFIMDYDDGILPALDYFGLTDIGLFNTPPYGEIPNRVLEGVKDCSMGIANISPAPQDFKCPRNHRRCSCVVAPNGNVLFEAGLLRGHGKPLMLVFCDEYSTGAKVPSDLASSLRVEYSGRAELAFALIRWLKAFGFQETATK